MGNRAVKVTAGEPPVVETTTTQVEPADDFDYKGTLDGMSGDPVFRYHFLGESEAIPDEEISPEEYEELVNLETDDEAISYINQLIAKKARSLAGKHYDGILREKDDEDMRREARRGFRKKIAELGDIDDSYKFDFGDAPDDSVPLDDERFGSTNVGKLTRYLIDKGYNIEQVNDMLKDELYALGVRVNGHENKILRKVLSGGGGQEHPVLIAQKRVVEKQLPVSIDDEGKLREIIREAYKNGDKETLKLVKEKLRAN